MRIILKDCEKFLRLILIKGYSQRSFSRKLGYSEPYINQIIKRERNPSGQTAKRISELLEMEFDDIFKIENDNKC